MTFLQFKALHASLMHHEEEALRMRQRIARLQKVATFAWHKFDPECAWLKSEGEEECDCGIEEIAGECERAGDFDVDDDEQGDGDEPNPYACDQCGIAVERKDTAPATRVFCPTCAAECIERMADAQGGGDDHN